jgi:hypothetical protein
MISAAFSFAAQEGGDVGDHVGRHPGRPRGAEPAGHARRISDRPGTYPASIQPIRLPGLGVQITSCQGDVRWNGCSVGSLSIPISALIPSFGHAYRPTEARPISMLLGLKSLRVYGLSVGWPVRRCAGSGALLYRRRRGRLSIPIDSSTAEGLHFLSRWIQENCAEVGGARRSASRLCACCEG